jgi:hypothetical protein
MSAIKYSDILLLLLIATILSGQACKSKPDYRKRALAHFTESRMISSYTHKERDAAIRLKKAMLGLEKEWSFVKEDVHVVEVDKGDTDFLVIYTVVFENVDNNQYYTVEERYYSTPDVYGDPVPLRTTEFRINISTGKGNIVRERTLWDGDFDAYLGRHMKKSISPDAPAFEDG